MTCVGALDTGTPNPNVLMSGAKDGTITVWDIRSQKPAIHMAIFDAADDSSAMVRLQPLLTHPLDLRILCVISCTALVLMYFIAITPPLSSPELLCDV